MTDELVLPWQNAVPPIFGDCITSDYCNYRLFEPWREDGFIYASDGKILVRMPESALAAPSQRNCITLYRHRPGRKRVCVDSASKFAKHHAGLYFDEPFPLPLFNGPRFLTCEQCGSPEEPNHYCDNCGCEPLPNLMPVPVCGWLILSAFYVSVLRDRKCLLYLPRTYEKPWPPVRFTCGAVEGLLMPICPDADEKKEDA